MLNEDIAAVDRLMLVVTCESLTGSKLLAMNKTIPFLLLFLFFTTISASESLSPRVLKTVKANTVYIEVTGPNIRGSGSGWVMDNGLIVTNAHVIGKDRNAQYAVSKITGRLDTGDPSERKLELELIAFSTPADLAFLKPKRRGTPLPRGLSLAKTSEMRETMPIWIIGFPFGDAIRNGNIKLSPTIGNGTISKIGKDEKNPEFIAQIQINGDINPGNSGGPIVDKRGNVVAVAKQTIIGANIGFAIPPSIVNVALDGASVSLSHTLTEPKESSFSMDFIWRVCDPLSRITSIRRGVFHGKLSEKRPQKTYDGSPHDAYGAPSDGNITWVNMKKDRKNPGEYIGSISRIPYTKNSQWGLFMIVEIRRRGKLPLVMVTEPLTHERILKIKDAVTERDREDEIQRAADPSAAPSKNSWQVISLPPAKGSRKAITAEKVEQVSVNDPTLSSFKVANVPMSLIPIAPIEGKSIAPIDYAVSLDGSGIYLAFRNKSEVHVYDTDNLEAAPQIIRTPQFPKRIDVGPEHVFITCEESGMILVIDAKTKKPVSALSNPMEEEGYYPKDFWGPAGDGFYYASWIKKGEPWWDNHHVRYKLNDWTKPEIIGKAAPFRIVPIWTHLYLKHGEFSHSPSGTLSSGSLTNPKHSREHLPSAKSFEYMPDRFSSYHTNTMPLTFDFRGKELYLSFNLHGTGIMTQRLNHKLQIAGTPFKGAVTAQLPHKNELITYDWSDPKWMKDLNMGGQGGKSPIIRVIDSVSGATKLAVISTLPKGASRERYRDYHAAPSYIPGREEVVFIVQKSSGGSNYQLAVMPIGNLKNASRGASSQDFGGTLSAPPISGKVGTKLSWKPNAPQMSGAVFSAKAPQDGMTVNPRTGAWAWTPSPWQIGKFDVEIMVTLPNGTVSSVKRWSLEIKP